MKKTNNKGFSLVELIVVIAIMAVLIVVLAPQFTKYVERSRNSTDKQNATAIVTAVQVWASETEIPSGETALAADTTGTAVTVSATGATVGTGTNNAAITSALKNAGIDTTKTKCASKTAWTSYTITFKVDNAGVVSYTYNPVEIGGGTTPATP